ncbi:hypothetical protein M0802_004143 [Mischocyttarus mexicanus]|nr:hypothetical protein M0802_004143 [Mischocyttarus mexicanus]
MKENEPAWRRKSGVGFKVDSGGKRGIGRGHEVDVLPEVKISVPVRKGDCRISGLDASITGAEVTRVAVKEVLRDETRRDETRQDKTRREERKKEILKEEKTKRTVKE